LVIKFCAAPHPSEQQPTTKPDGEKKGVPNVVLPFLQIYNQNITDAVQGV
jgi:hypothetical protein